MSIGKGNLLVSGVSVMISAGLEDSLLLIVVDNSDEMVEDVDCVNNVVVLTNENRTMQGSAVSVMVSAVLEDSVL
jgi:hypothetical protein